MANKKQHLTVLRPRQLERSITMLPFFFLKILNTLIAF